MPPKPPRLLLALVLVLGARAGAGAEEGVPVLQDGVAATHKLARGKGTWVGRVDVPADATALGVAVFGDADVDLFLHQGSPVQKDLETDADAAAFSSAAQEVVTLSPLGQVRLVPGAWYVTVRNPFATLRGASFEVVAFVDRPDGPRTLLPGRPALLNLPAGGHAEHLRTFLPQSATGATVDLELPDRDGLRYTLAGEGDFRQEGEAGARIEVPAEHVPAGGLDLALASRAETGTFGVSLRLTWTFQGGSTLPVAPDPLLEPGVPQTLTLGGSEHAAIQRLRIPVSEGVGGLVLEASNPDGRDIDLFVSRDGPPEDGVVGADWLAFSTADHERLVVGGRKELPAGTYHGEIVLNEPDEAVDVTVSVTLLDVGAGPYTWSKTDAPRISPDDWLLGSVRIHTSAVSWYAVDVPRGTRAIYVQLLDAGGPLDLFLAREDDGKILSRALTPLVNERLEHAFPAPLAAPQRFLVGVLNRDAWEEDEVGFRVSVGLDRPPELPGDLVWPPLFGPAGATLPERVAAATVEITIDDSSGGSGVLVSPRGLVLSCRHCLQASEVEDTVQRANILVGVTRRPDLAAVQAYRARLWAEYPEQDLVLLELTEDVFGRKPPANLQLPWLPLGDSDALRLGEDLWVGGFPEEGSEGLRTPIVITRGVLAGLERQGGLPRWLKTDAWIAPGHSGGAVVDGRGRLVGISAATLGSTESLGLAVPISRLPDEWKARILKDLR